MPSAADEGVANRIGPRAIRRNSRGAHEASADQGLSLLQAPPAVVPQAGSGKISRRAYQGSYGSQVQSLSAGIPRFTRASRRAAPRWDCRHAAFGERAWR